ncbi:MAG: metallophosphoesterase family protein [Deltaproteobacteria bacterium]|nr:metallophosphoesterase family protein [Deltaproteobacteria bacterium]
MNIAIIGDIHANFTALEAVLKDLTGRCIEEIWDLGDIIGGGAYPHQTASKLSSEEVTGIIGNYDRKILDFPGKARTWKKKKHPDKYAMWKFTYEELSDASMDYIRTLPEQRRLTRNGWEILMVHGSPESIDEHLSQDTPEERLRELSDMAQADIVLCGHSHRPFVREVDGTTFINPGGLGIQDTGDPRASYAVLKLTDRSFQVNHYLVPYDVDLAAQSVREKGLPEIYARMVLSGKGFSSALAEDDPDKKEFKRNVCVSQALALGREHGFEVGHALQTTRIALKIFDDLTKLHSLSMRERNILECASILHDIGIAYGTNGHHKKSMELIREHGLNCFSEEEIDIIALVARYHRKALPREKHDIFSELSKGNRSIVVKLAAILRLADGLDRTHRNIVGDLDCSIEKDRIVIHFISSGDAEEEIAYGRIKSDLMKAAFDLDVEIEEAKDAH